MISPTCKWIAHGSAESGSLVCGRHNHATTLQELLEHTQKQTEVNLLAKLLTERELKKPAHDKYYALVTSNGAHIPESGQTNLI